MNFFTESDTRIYQQNSHEHCRYFDIAVAEISVEI